MLNAPPPLPKRQPSLPNAPAAKSGPLPAPASARPASPDWLMFQPEGEEPSWLQSAAAPRAPHGLSFSFGFAHPLVPTPIRPTAAPPSYAVPSQPGTQHNHTGVQAPVTRTATPPYPAGSGTHQLTQVVGQMSHDVLDAAQHMEAQNYSFVSATPKPPFQIVVQFEQNPHTFQVLMGPVEAEWTAKTTAMTQAGWTYFGRRSEGAFNQVLIYTR